jgi:phosphinothricin acetyltransferase
MDSLATQPHHSGMNGSDLILRDSTLADLPAITRIYGHWVLNGLASFELEPPDEAEMARRREAVLAGGYPHIVATDKSGEVLGYAYASAYRTRPAYRFTVEDSIYVAPDAGRRGIGQALLPLLIARCEAAGFRLMVAVIGDSGNAGSIGLHARCGFARVGTLPAIGWKHDQWVDSVLMSRPLGDGATTPPPPGR